ncbi:hypothetical protein U1Q18_027922, partial [Sarracenia purpurea var. burkii]
VLESDIENTIRGRLNTRQGFLFNAENVVLQRFWGLSSAIFGKVHMVSIPEKEVGLFVLLCFAVVRGLCLGYPTIFLLKWFGNLSFTLSQPLYIVIGFEFGLVAAAASSWCVVFVASIPEEIVCFWFYIIVVSDPTWCWYDLWSISGLSCGVDPLLQFIWMELPFALLALLPIAFACFGFSSSWRFWSSSSIGCYLGVTACLCFRICWQLGCLPGICWLPLLVPVVVT